MQRDYGWLLALVGKCFPLEMTDLYHHVDVREVKRWGWTITVRSVLRDLNPLGQKKKVDEQIIKQEMFIIYATSSAILWSSEKNRKEKNDSGVHFPHIQVTANQGKFVCVFFL